MGEKPAEAKKYITPPPNAYAPENSIKYLQEKIEHSLGIKLEDPKPFLTPAPGTYRPEDC